MRPVGAMHFENGIGLGVFLAERVHGEPVMFQKLLDFHATPNLRKVSPGIRTQSEIRI
jgi:hypothetical protein